MRSYRTHNLWFDYYHLKTRVPRVIGYSTGLVKRMSKTYSGVSCRACLGSPSHLVITAIVSNFSLLCFRLVTSVSSTA